MREIKFRGKRVDTGEWVYGFLVRDTDGDMPYIVERAYWSTCEGMDFDQTLCYEVDPSTVGQFTGLKDKAGRDVYEGDLLSTDLDRPYLIVVFRNGCFMVQCHDSGENYFDLMVPVNPKTYTLKYHEVIGNEHEDLPQ